VDISEPLAAAWNNVAEAGPEDGPWGELMATYVELGELMERWNRSDLDMTDTEYIEACDELVERLQVLGSAHSRYLDQRDAVYHARLDSDFRTENG
jgi:hypothetical protein